MSNQFYRKLHSKSEVLGRLKKITRTKSVLYTILVVIPVVSFVTFSNKGVLKRMTLESDKQAMIDKVHEAQLEQARLVDQSKALDKDPRAIEKVAREKYGMIREGETVYKVRKN
jgi:cell division protein FtsB